jgi:thiol-disulfide isomerase/thioredoxin
MKTFLFQAAIILNLSSVLAQPAEPCPNSKNALKYYNGFQHTKSDPAKINLALSYAQGLARECPATLQSLFHTFFSQAFIKEYRDKYDNTNERKLLNLFINDTNQVLIQTARPIHLWVQVQENQNNPAESIKLTNTFIDTQLNTSEMHDNRTSRYALLIYLLIYNKKECSQIAQALLTKTIATLSRQIPNYDLAGDAVHNRKRAWYRYLYAYIHFLQAEQAHQKGDLVKAEEFYRIASLYSPDEADQQVYAAYYYDKVFLQGKDNYIEEYLYFLASNPNKTKSLESLTQLAIEKPANLSRLASFYNQHYPDKEPFSKYWETELNKNLKVAPDFTLQLLNNSNFSLTQHKGRWVLMDFWGTWCAPCIEEMPKMQRFYREATANHADKISVITIACKDTALRVKTFLNKHAYNFPVAMATADIEKEYAVTTYPTKILITPTGNILTLPYGTDWVQQVKLYAQLQ